MKSHGKTYASWSFLMDVNLSPSELHSKPAPLKKLSSQKPWGIVQCQHFNGPSVIEPENFRFVDVSMHNLSVRQNERFPAEPFETHADRRHAARRRRHHQRSSGHLHLEMVSGKPCRH